MINSVASLRIGQTAHFGCDGVLDAAIIARFPGQSREILSGRAVLAQG